VASKIVNNKKELRAKFVNNSVYENDPARRWVLDTPYEIRDTAMRDYVKACKSTRELYKTGRIKSYDMHFRSKKDKQQSITVRNREYKKTPGHNTFSFARGSFKSAGVLDLIGAREPLPAEIGYDARLTRTRLGEWYLCVPMALDDVEQDKAVHELGGDNQASSVMPQPPATNVCALDPGVRCFQTLYDPSRPAVIEIGAGDISRIYRLGHAADKLQSKRSAVHGHKRYSYQRAYLRILRKIRRLVDELHCKTAKFLTDNYNVVLLPSFDTAQMAANSRGARRISSKAVRGMMSWAHYRFKQRLLNKAYNASGSGKCHVVVCKEDYTSKTCTVCGTLNTTLGGAKVFGCASCGLRIGRDYNGARNILLKNASYFGFGVSQAQSSAEATLLGDLETDRLAKSDQDMDMHAIASH